MFARITPKPTPLATISTSQEQSEQASPPTVSFRAARNSIVLMTVLSLMFGAAFLAYAEPLYRAVALVSVDPKFEDLIKRRQVPTDATADSAVVATEVEILQSEYIAGAVVAAENLAEEQVLFRPNWRDIVRGWATSIGLRSPAANVRANREQRAIAALMRSTSIKRVDATYIVSIAVDMPSAEMAARIANTYARVFISARLNAVRQQAKSTSELLAERALDLQKQVTSAETALENLRLQGASSTQDAATTKVTLRNLESKAQIFRKLYDKLLEGYAEANEVALTAGSRVQLVSSASEPLTKHWPSTTLILAASLAIGVAAGSLLTLLRSEN